MKKDFYTRLLAVSSENNSILLYDGRVVFNLDEVDFVIDFESTELLNKNEISALHEIEDLPEKLCQLTIESIFIYFLEDHEEFFFPKMPKRKAITKTMYQMVRKLMELNPLIIKSFDTYIDSEGLIESVNGYCDIEQSSLSCKIELNVELGATLDTVNLISILSKELPRLDSIYTFFSKEKNQEILKDDFNLEILHVSTKTRRLGYFKLLSTLFDEGKQYPVNRFSEVFENEALAIESELLEYKNTKGLIKKTQSGNSAKPYVKLAHDLGLINYLRSSVVQGKIFKVYSELRMLDSDQQNFFMLTNLDKLFFLEQILRRDTLYFFVILESLFLYNESSFFNLQTIFRESVLKRLRKFEGFVRNKGENRKANNLQSVRQRVEAWEKPEKYLEHVLMPRLNWMLDLDLVSFTQKNTFVITEKGERLVKHYWDWQDLYGGVVINPNGMLDFVYIAVFNELYGDGKDNPQAESAIKKRVNALIAESFEHFKTMAPNRVTASQAIAFTQYSLFLKESIKTGKPFIRRLLSEEFIDQFIYKHQSQYKDGYIQIIR